MTPWFVYWIIKLDSLRTLLSGITLIFTLAFSVIISIKWQCKMDNKPVDKNLKRIGRVVQILAILFAALWLCTPTTKEAVAIYVIPKVVNNEQVQSIPDNLSKLFNVKLEEWVNDTINKKK